LSFPATLIPWIGYLWGKPYELTVPHPVRLYFVHEEKEALISMQNPLKAILEIRNQRSASDEGRRKDQDSLCSRFAREREARDGFARAFITSRT